MKSTDMDTPSKKRNPNILTSLNRALKVLDLLSVRHDLGVSEVSRILGYDKSSVYKMLYTLEHRGYVIKSANARYQLSKKLSIYNDQETARQNILDVAIPHMRRLRDESGETVYMGVLNTNGRVIFMHKEDGRSPDSIITRTAYELDVYTNAAGKILMANLDPAMQSSLLHIIHLQAHTSRTVTSRQQLQQQFDSLRGAAWAEQYDENYIGHSDVASPLYQGDGRCVAALSIACSTATLKKSIHLFRPMLLRAAAEISRKMGWDGTFPV
jgi:DNA-binding IclR family transcriptional regulator